MYKRYYDSYGTRKAPSGELIVPEPIAANRCVEEEATKACDDIEIAGKACSRFGGLPFEIDDLILIGILIFLLMDKNNDDDSNDSFIYIIIGIIVLSELF